MGYKLAGFDVIGCNEIDHRMMFTYCKNHNPRFPFLEPIQTFKDKQDLPPELFNLDILDGSPPCSTFSMAGSREEAWGKMKKFREGQAEQVLDTLFFDFIQLAKRLQPKVVVAENVKGLLLGSAKEYMTNIYRGFDDAGYYVNHYLLDAQTMGVPQRRQRVFFVCLRKDLVGFVPCEQTREQIAKYPAMGTVYRQFVAMLGKYVDKYNSKDKFFLVGYNNAAFDNQFLRGFFLQNNDKFFGSWFWANTMDVMVLATVYLANKRTEMENFKLSTVAATLGVQVDGDSLHNAMYDIELTKAVFDIVTDNNI